MGNQPSTRFRSSSTSIDVSNDPLPWRRNSGQREYPLPSIVTPADGRVKTRKASSPTLHCKPQRSGSHFKSLRTLRPPSPPFSARGATDSTDTNTTSTTPLTTIVHPLEQQDDDFLWISGRKYTDSQYMLPCDEEEVDRLHFLHFMIRFAIQGNYLAPVSDVLRKGGRVLDVGCGPGTWTMEIAGEYPRSQVIGVDISSMFPLEIKPSNCTFQQCNILDGLPFEDESFDFIFMRFVGLGIPTEKWATVIADLVRLLKPGGWIELTEADAEIYRAGPTFREYNDQFLQVLRERNLDPAAGKTLKDRLEATDQVMNVTSSFISCPGGVWAGKLGQLTLQSWKAYYRALAPQICRTLNLPLNQYTERLHLCLSEADEYKTFENVHFAYAQKKQQQQPRTNTNH